MIVKIEEHICIVRMGITNASVKSVIDALIVNAVEH